jgi:hypothetical protein
VSDSGAGCRRLLQVMLILGTVCGADDFWFSVSVFYAFAVAYSHLSGCISLSPWLVESGSIRLDAY